MSPMTTEEIVQGLLDLAQANEWTYHRKRCGRGCCDESYMACESCDGKEETGHTAECSFVAFTKAAREYLNPPTNSAQTLWERIENETLSDHPS